MIDLINADTDQMQNDGFSLDNDQKVNVEIVRSIFDGKMAAILSSAGSTSCQLCTATHRDKRSRLDSTSASYQYIYTLPGHKYLYRPKFPLIFLRIYLLIIESTH